MIDGQDYFDQPVRNDLITYNNIPKKGNKFNHNIGGWGGGGGGGGGGVICSL